MSGAPFQATEIGRFGVTSGFVYAFFSAMSEFTDLPNDPNELKRVIADLQQKISAMERTPKAETAISPASILEPSQVDITPINEGEVTLRRLVQRIAMILQAEMIVIMFYDREKGELIGIPPAFGLEEPKLKQFRVRATHGISGQVFRETTPIVFHDVLADERAQDEPFALMHVQNGICVALVIEKRDEENRVVERSTIGVLHAFNKRHGEEFNDEDVRLLERMAKNVGSIIANLQLYREVVEEREELLQTFESVSFGLVLVSTDGRVAQINSSARQLLGVPIETNGRTIGELMPNAHVREFFESYLAGHEPGTAEISAEIAGSHRLLELQGANVRSEDGKNLGVVGIVNDVTEIRNIDKMKSSFVAMASHELRTPLTAIKGFVRTLIEGEDYYSREDRMEFHQIIDNECDRLKRLIDDLLNTARIEAGESLKPNYTEFAIEPLLNKVVMIQKQATERHKIILDIENQLPSTIIGDEDKLDQILTNLLNNAIKYAPNGGDIIVHAKNEGETLLLGVQDHGLGIPADHLDKVFEKFHRVNNEDNRKIYGTGLGLYLVKHLVDRVHLGNIWVESEPGVGSTFWFRIPTQLDIEKAKAEND